MKKEPTNETLAVWARLNRAGTTVRATIESGLKKAGLPQLEWYDALSEIERAGPTGIRPTELMDQLLIAQYSLSRLLGRLEKSGFVRRTILKNDARGQTIFLTDAGRKMRLKMWPVFAEALQESVGNKLDLAESLRLGQYLRRLIQPSDRSRF